MWRFDITSVWISKPDGSEFIGAFWYRGTMTATDVDVFYVCTCLAASRLLTCSQSGSQLMPAFAGSLVIRAKEPHSNVRACRRLL